MAPTPEEMGHCDSVYLSELGDTQVVVFKHGDLICCMYFCFIRKRRDKRLVPGGGATEIELAKQITSYGETCPGLDQYAIKKFGEALKSIPRALAENFGVKANEVLSKLYATHQEVNKNIGFDIEIIMAKAAGGPKTPKQQGHWDKDDWQDEPDN